MQSCIISIGLFLRCKIWFWIKHGVKGGFMLGHSCKKILRLPASVWLKRLFCSVLVIQLLSCTNLYAYLDPATGSYMLQMLAAVFLGSLYLIKIFWSKIREFFAKLFKRADKNK